jgi:hypothetical protein
MTLIDMIPMFLSDPDFTIYPMGGGYVLNATIVAGDKGMLFLMGVPDHLHRGVAPATEIEAIEIASGDGPKCALGFDNVEALDRFILQLVTLRSDMRASAKEGAVQ